MAHDISDLAPPLPFDDEMTRRLRAGGPWTDDTLAGWVRANAEKFPDRAAITWDGGRLSHGELAGRVEGLAGGLAGLGMGKGDVVATLLNNTPEFLMAYYAIPAVGGVIQPVHMAYARSDVVDLLAHSGAQAVICADGGRLLAGDGLPPSLRWVIGVGAAPPPLLAFGELNGPVPDMEPAGADCYLLLYTSGTSASPKSVPTANQNRTGNARICARDLQFSEHDIVLSAAPFSHSYGLWGVDMATFSGASIHLCESFSPPAFAQAIAASGATFLYMAPAHMAGLLASGAVDEKILDTVRVVVLAGAACPAEQTRAFDKLLNNGRVVQLWGMSEIQAGTLTRHDDDVEIPALSAGPPPEGNEIRIADADSGRVLGVGREGELQIRGCSVFPGYFNNPDANAQSFTEDGWFRSGDLAVMDEGGRASLTGRIKDIINRGGVKYNPADLEELLLAHPDIAQASIVPMPDERLGERACCFIVPAGDRAPGLDDIQAFLEARGITKNKWPERVERIAEMPSTPTKKVIKGELVRYLRQLDGDR